MRICRSLGNLASLSDLPVEEDVGGVFVVDHIDPEQILPSWRAARAAVSVIDRWPVMIGPEEVSSDPTPDGLADMRDRQFHA